MKSKSANETKANSLKFYIFLALTIAIMVIIFFFSSQNAEESNEVSNSALDWIAENIFRNPQTSGSLSARKMIRKIAHFSIYLCLGVSTSLTVGEWKRTVQCGYMSRRRLLSAWLIPVIYACTDELHQYFVPGRSSELRDVCIDSIGALTGVAVVWLAGVWKSRICGHDKKKDTP